MIPVLLLHKGGLVKSVKFRNYKYVGDPINAVKIFNEKEIDEIIILDIDASAEERGPNFSQIATIAGEAFIPLAYGGGITTVDQVRELMYNGVEKVIFNNAAIHSPNLLTQAAAMVGSQSVVASIDVKKDMLGRYKVFASNGTKNTKLDPVEFAQKIVKAGAGELFVNSIERDGTFSGFDIPLISKIAHAVDVPVIACGGAACVDDFKSAVASGASAVAAGSMFVFQRPHNAVLISYPSQQELKEKLYTQV